MPEIFYNIFGKNTGKMVLFKEAFITQKPQFTIDKAGKVTCQFSIREEQQFHRVNLYNYNAMLFAIKYLYDDQVKSQTDLPVDFE